MTPSALVSPKATARHLPQEQRLAIARDSLRVAAGESPPTASSRHRPRTAIFIASGASIIANGGEKAIVIANVLVSFGANGLKLFYANGLKSCVANGLEIIIADGRGLSQSLRAQSVSPSAPGWRPSSLQPGGRRDLYSHRPQDSVLHCRGAVSVAIGCQELDRRRHWHCDKVSRRGLYRPWPRDSDPHRQWAEGRQRLFIWDSQAIY